MREVLADVRRWRAQGRRVALGRVVEIEGSGPREPGASMAVNDAGEVSGSVSGGCVEGAVVAEAVQLLESGEPGRVVTFGYSDDEAFAVGLTCGGTVHLFLDEVDDDDLLALLVDDLDAHRPVALVTQVVGPDPGATVLVSAERDPRGSLGDVDLDRVVIRDATAAVQAGTTDVRHYGRHGEARQDEVSVFVATFAPPPRMLVFGAVDFTAALVRVAKVLGYHVTVCDAREVFATKRRFPLADDVVVDWPHRLLERVGAGLGPRDAICVLTHDHKFDVPAIEAALGTQVGYLGAMGSRRTHDERLKRLEEVGVDRVVLDDRLRSPIGLDLGARTPEETAVSICAEIISLRTGRDGRPLKTVDGPIHGGG